MPNKAREQVQREINLIIKLQSEGKSKDEIIKELNICDRTYKRYKRKIMLQVIKDHKPDPNSVKFREADFIKTLEDAYIMFLKMATDSKIQHSVRLEAVKAMCTVKAQLAKLSRDGPVFEPQLPSSKVVEVEVREINV